MRKLREVNVGSQSPTRTRAFALPANAVADRVNASFRDGVLTVEIPKAEEAKPKVISIKSS